MTTAIQEYDATEAGLAELRHRLKDVRYDVSTAKGLGEAKADRYALTKLRTSLETKRKELKAPALERAKAIDTEAERIRLAIVELEEPIDEQVKAEERRKEQERQAKIDAERLRVAGIVAAIGAIRSLVSDAIGQHSGFIAGVIQSVEAPSRIDFAEYAAEAKAATEETLAKLRQLQALAEAAEVRAAAQAAEETRQREELNTRRRRDEERVAREAEQRRRENEERDRQLAEARAENVRLQQQADEREAADRRQREEREQVERERAEAARLRDEQERETAASILRERQDAEQRQADEKAAAERAEKQRVIDEAQVKALAEAVERTKAAQALAAAAGELRAMVVRLVELLRATAEDVADEPLAASLAAADALLARVPEPAAMPKTLLPDPGLAPTPPVGKSKRGRT